MKGDLPDWAADKLTSHVEIRFSFVDCVRILFGRRAHLRVETTLEHEVGRFETTSTVHVSRFRLRRPRFSGYTAVDISLVEPPDKPEDTKA